MTDASTSSSSSQSATTRAASTIIMDPTHKSGACGLRARVADRPYRKCEFNVYINGGPPQRVSVWDDAMGGGGCEQRKATPTIDRKKTCTCLLNAFLLLKHSNLSLYDNGDNWTKTTQTTETNRSLVHVVRVVNILIYCDCGGGARVCTTSTRSMIPIRIFLVRFEVNETRLLRPATSRNIPTIINRTHHSRACIMVWTILRSNTDMSRQAGRLGRA